MNLLVMAGILFPFLGTVLGASAVLFVRKRPGMSMSMALMGFTSGVMMAAAVWSLLLPALERNEHMGRMACVPVAAGFLAGIAFLLVMDRCIPHLHGWRNRREGPGTRLSGIVMMVLAITLHNIPEGMAVGVVFSESLSGKGASVSLTEAFLLSLGIALQNIPEGMIVSLPLKTEGKTRGRAFFTGVMSGVVEPVAAVLTLVLASHVEQFLSGLLAFAAGAMVYVVVEELVPESSGGEKSDWGTVGFSIGFVLMMVLDVI